MATRGKYAKIDDQLRTRIIDFYNHGDTISEISEKLSVNRRTVSSIVSKYKSTGQILRQQTPRSKKLNSDQIAIVRGWIDEDCQISLETIAERVESEFNIKVSRTGVNNYLKSIHYT